jgi:hypothetical protein
MFGADAPLLFRFMGEGVRMVYHEYVVMRTLPKRRMAKAMLSSSCPDVRLSINGNARM